MNELARLDALFAQHGYTDFRWIKPQDIVVAHWVRMKCMFGCATYGHNATCPPNLPTIQDCRRFFDEYRAAAIFHFAKQTESPEERHEWTRQVNEGLLKLEREVFLAGYYKAFVLGVSSCILCADCPGERIACRQPRSARPGPDGMGIDVFPTVRQAGYSIAVLTDYGQTMNRYAFLLVE